MAHPENLSSFTDSSGQVTLHHYAAAPGNPESLDLHTSEFGKSPWSKAEVKAESTPKTFFYVDPSDKERWFEGREHYVTKHPADKIYDLMADPKKIVERVAARPPFNLTKVLHVLKRLGYHGVFYSGSFPTVAMLQDTKVTRAPKEHEEPVKLALTPRPTQSLRAPLSPPGFRGQTPFITEKPKSPEFTHGPGNPSPLLTIHHDLEGGLGRLTFTRTRISPFHGPTWTVSHNDKRHKVFSGPEFSAWLNRLPQGHAVRKTIVDALRAGPKRLARSQTVHEMMAETAKEKSRIAYDNGSSSGQRKMLVPGEETAADNALLHTDEPKVAAHYHKLAFKAHMLHSKTDPDNATYHDEAANAHKAAYRHLEGMPEQRNLPWNDSLDAQSATRRLGSKGFFEPPGMHEIADAALEHAGHEEHEDAALAHMKAARLLYEHTKELLKDGASAPRVNLHYNDVIRAHIRAARSHRLYPRVVRFPEKMQFARSGYGYCYECKAPFIRHDKQTSLVHCPNGHKRRYVGRPTRLSRDFVESEHPRDNGKFTDKHTGATQKAHEIIKALKGLPKAAVEKGRQQVKSAYTKLTTRYGRTYARLAVASGLLGLPVPLPGASVLFAAPVLAIAELHKQMKRERPKEGLDAGKIRQAGRWFIKLVFGRGEGPKKLARMENTSTVHGLTNELSAEDTHPSDMRHGMLSDALLDTDDPRAGIVRYHHEQGKLLDPTKDRYGGDTELYFRAKKHAMELSGTPVGMYHTSDMRQLPVGHGLLNVHRYMSGDGSGYHVKYTHGRRIHSQPMSSKQYREWLRTLDPDQAEELDFFSHIKSSPVRLAATRAPANGAIVNNQFHVGGQFLPRAFKRISRVIQMATKHERMRALKLARKSVEKLPVPTSASESTLSPEEHKAGQDAKGKKQYEKLVTRSVSNHPRSVLPTVDEIKTLATVGGSVKGQYEHAGKVLTSFIGPDNAKLFVAANAILSPLASWEHHSRAALRLVRLWRDAGSPRDEQSVHELVERLNPSREDGERTESGEKLYPSISWGSKSKKLRHMLMNADDYIKRIENVKASGRGKIVEFGRAFFDPNGVPVDTHMAKMMVPSAASVTGNTADVHQKELRALIRSTKTPHKLAAAIAGGTNKGLHKALLDAQKKLVSKPVVAKAYKVAIAHAAEQLKWEPRQVQEAVWSAIVSLVATRNLKIPPAQILSHLRHENAFQAWNVGGLLSTPEVQKDVGGLSQRPVAAFVQEANRPPAESGAIEGVPGATLAALASKLPPGGPVGAWGAIQQSIRDRRKPSLF